MWAKLPVEVKQRVLSELSLVWAGSIGLTSVSNLALYKAHAGLRVQACFARFSLPTEETLQIMQQTNTIISGSSALAVIERVNYEPGDLDIYTPTTAIERIRRFILSKRYIPMDADAYGTEDRSDGWLPGGVRSLVGKGKFCPRREMTEDVNPSFLTFRHQQHRILYQPPHQEGNQPHGNATQVPHYCNFPIPFDDCYEFHLLERRCQRLSSNGGRQDGTSQYQCAGNTSVRRQVFSQISKARFHDTTPCP